MALFPRNNLFISTLKAFPQEFASNVEKVRGFAKNLAIESARAIPRVGGQLVQQGRQIAGEQKPLFVPRGKLQQIVLGEDPIRSITDTGEQIVQDVGFSPQTAQKFGPRVGIGLAALDVFPGKPSKKLIIPTFKGLRNLSTTIVEKLRGRTTVSKQFISDLTNSPDVRQVERELIREVLEDSPATIPVKEFAERVETKLLKITREIAPQERYGKGFRYESIVLPNELRGNVANYSEEIYISPIKNSAGDIHFPGGSDNYFAHVRVEDLASPTGKTLGVEDITDVDILVKGKGAQGFVPTQTRRIIELQSDLFQKGRLEKSVFIEATPGTFERYSPEVEALVNQLQPYRNLWHERIIREEIKRAAKDGKTKLQFPTGETAMKVEGLGEINRFVRGLHDAAPVIQSDLKVGKEVWQGGQNWIITDVLGEGKFKAIPKNSFETKDAWEVIEDVLPNGEKIWLSKNSISGSVITSTSRKQAVEVIESEKRVIENLSEEFDISGKIDTSNPIFRFYEKDIQKFLKRIRPDMKQITDPQGVTWYEISLNKQDALDPIKAFGAVVPLGFFGQEE